MHELNRRCLSLLRCAVNVGLGPRRNPLAAKLDEGGLLDPAKAREDAPAPPGIINLDHECRDQLLAFGNQRIIGGKLVLNLFRPAFLDKEHLVDLHPHGLVGFEIEGDAWPNLDPAVALACRELAARLLAYFAVLGERQDIAWRQDRKSTR